MHHRIPIAWFVKECVENPQVINALENLQPLWLKDHVNRHKELNKFTLEQREFWVELFTYHIELSFKAELNLKKYPLDLSTINNIDFTSNFQSSNVSILSRSQIQV